MSEEKARNISSNSSSDANNITEKNTKSNIHKVGTQPSEKKLTNNNKNKE